MSTEQIIALFIGALGVKVYLPVPDMSPFRITFSIAFFAQRSFRNTVGCRSKFYFGNGRVGYSVRQFCFKFKFRHFDNFCFFTGFKFSQAKQGKPIEQILKKIKQYTTGWLGYYAICDMEGKVKSLNELIRRRIRQIYWKQCKKVSAKFTNLKKLGIDRYKAWEWANSRKGYWRISGSFILSRTLTNKYLASFGYDDISKRYKVLHSSY